MVLAFGPFFLGWYNASFIYDIATISYIKAEATVIPFKQPLEIGWCRRMLCFTNASLVLSQRILKDGYLVVDNGKIVAFGQGPFQCPQTSSSTVVDCHGLYLSPGFVDIHTHGAGGADFMDGSVDAIITAARMHLKHGTTTLLPTTLTSSDDDLYATIDNFKKARDCRDDMPHLEGLHLEGPYFCEQEKGAQDSRFLLIPKKEHYMPIVEYGEGSIVRWSLAPELPGALEMADTLVPMGIRLSAAHTAATYDEISAGFDHGIAHLTHFYSGMSTIVRKQGVCILGAVEAGYLIDGMTLEVIADGMHLPPELLKLIFKNKDHTKICACTDSMRGAGMPEGPSILGALSTGQPVVIEDGIAKMPDRTCFAGSVCTGDRLVRVLRDTAGLPLWEAVRATSSLPAEFMGFGEKTGAIAIGKQADLVLFDESISIHNVYVGGVECAV